MSEEKEYKEMRENLKKELDKCGKIDGEVKILWHSGYYDGVLSGMLLYNDIPHWFDLAMEDDDIIYNEEKDEYTYGPEGNWYRKFWVYSLNNDNIIRLFSEHGLWQGHVGLHCDYFPVAGRTIRSAKKTTINTLHYGGVQEDHKGKTYWAIYESARDLLQEKLGAFNIKECEKIGWIYYDQLFKNLPKIKKNEEVDEEEESR